MIKNDFVQNSTIGAISTNYHMSLEQRIDCDCGRLLFIVEENKIEIECRRCKKKKIIIYDENDKKFRVIE